MQTLIGRFANAAEAGRALRALQQYQPVGATMRRGISRQARLELGVMLGLVAGLVLSFTVGDGMPSRDVLFNGAHAQLLGNLILGTAMGVPGGLAVGMLLSLLPLQGGPAFRVSRVSRYANTLTVYTAKRWTGDLTSRLRAEGATKIHTIPGAMLPDAVGAAMDTYFGNQRGFRTV